MPKSPEVLAEELIDTAQKAEDAVWANWGKLEDCAEAREKHAKSSAIGHLHPEVVRTHLRLVASVPIMTVKGIGLAAKGIYRQKRYAKAAGVETSEAFLDAIDRQEDSKQQNLDGAND